MPEGPDHYRSMAELYANEVEGVNYSKEWYRHRWRYQTGENYKKENEVFIMAPHGGSIESGTTELALATAGFTDDFDKHPAEPGTYDYFIFDGTNPEDQNGRLHVTASHYDDPVANELVQNSIVSLAFHGCTDEQPDQSTGNEYMACLIGGLDETFKELLELRLQGAGFNAFITSQETLNGDIPENIINQNKLHAGAQFEMTTSLRKSFYETNTRSGRRATTNDDFWLFVNTVREAIEHYKEQLSQGVNQPAFESH